jgi:hypothetical protein
MNSSSERALIWVLFWLFVLTAGNPDILDTLIQLLQTLSTHLGDRYA